MTDGDGGNVTPEAAAALVADKTWRTVEPLHGMIYFVPEAAEEYARLGITGTSGYFASPAAPMGAVSVDVVIATFFNFNPELVAGRHPRRMGPRHPHRPDRRPLQRSRCRVPSYPRQRSRRIAGDGPRRRAGAHRGRGGGAPRRGPPAGRGSRGSQVAGRASPPALARAVDPARVPGRRAHRAPRHPRAQRIGSACDPRRCGRRARSRPPRHAGVVRGGMATRHRRPPTARLARARRPTPFHHVGRGQRQEIEEGTDTLSSVPYRALGDEGCTELRALVRPWSKVFAEHLR